LPSEELFPKIFYFKSVLTYLIINYSKIRVVLILWRGYIGDMIENKFSQQAEDYRRVEHAIRYLEANFRSRPTLDEIAGNVSISKYHFTRLFKRWAGISPMRFMQFLTLEYTKRRLDESGSVLDASYDAGLSGPGRLHDLFVSFDAITPGEYKNLGKGLIIEYGFHPAPFGQCLLATTDRGICHLSFVEPDHNKSALARLRRHWAGSTLVENRKATGSLVKRIFAVLPGNNSRPFHLLVKGTNFQVNVWRALLAIPGGHMVSYRDIAAHIGRTGSARAVAGAVAVNPIGYLIPCHRVIAESGHIHGYRWGTARKKAIIGWEAARAELYETNGARN
jgi:AraC family transcriptional regulator of adaptative response/methylated-DNA-[protein]-cysteine methyltransferase